jgi:hypothetical protein
MVIFNQLFYHMKVQVEHVCVTYCSILEHIVTSHLDVTTIHKPFNKMFGWISPGNLETLGKKQHFNHSSWFNTIHFCDLGICEVRLLVESLCSTMRRCLEDFHIFRNLKSAQKPRRHQTTDWWIAIYFGCPLEQFRSESNWEILRRGTFFSTKQTTKGGISKSLCRARKAPPVFSPCSLSWQRGDNGSRVLHIAEGILLNNDK